MEISLNEAVTVKAFQLWVNATFQSPAPLVTSVKYDMKSSTIVLVVADPTPTPSPTPTPTT